VESARKIASASCVSQWSKSKVVLSKGKGSKKKRQALQSRVRTKSTSARNKDPMLMKKRKFSAVQRQFDDPKNKCPESS
jgi:hypothetical protein